MTKVEGWILKTAAKLDEIENVGKRRFVMVMLTIPLSIAGLIIGAVMGVVSAWDRIVIPVWKEYGDADIPENEHGV